MSADNYRKCPVCLKKFTQEREQDQRRVEESYGKVSPQDYAAALEELKRKPVLGESLGEMFSMGVDLEGRFFFDYGCYCPTCNFTFSRKHTEQLTDDELKSR